MRLAFGVLFLVMLVHPSLAASGRRPQSLTCPEQLAELTKQYAQECTRFNRPPACDICPTDSASCAAKCRECKIISDQIYRKTNQCGK